MVTSVPWVLKRFHVIFYLVFGLLVIGFFLVSSNAASANSKRLITVFADGQERTINTAISTVAEALNKAGVSLSENDLVEPALDTEIIDTVFRINVYRARPVTIVDNGKSVSVMSPYQSARLIAASAGMTVYPEDNFEMQRIDDFLSANTIGQRMTIIRATPININLYGNNVVHRTHATTIIEALAERGIQLGEADIVSPVSSNNIEKDMTVAVVRVGTEVTAIEEEIAFETDIIQDSNRMVGTREVETEGVVGTRLVTYEIELHNGEEASRTQLQEVIIEEPVTEVVIVGTKNPDPDSNIAIGQSLAAQRGWIDDEWTCLLNLWNRESRWNHLAENPSSGAYGIPQALPGSKMASAGADWRTNPATQIDWGLGYVAGRYGTPCGAWSFFTVNNWY